MVRSTADERRTPRPRSLAEAAARGTEGSRDANLREFLDEFYLETDDEVRGAMLETEPDRVSAKADAYLAAVAEHLALSNSLPVPEWTSSPTRFLDRAYFPCGLESLKAIYLAESPVSFRRRMVFVEADPLYRPRRAEPPASFAATS